jgi:small ligand-binding sensory domain FIST
VLFAPEVPVATGLSQGCAPIGESHVVSDSVDNVIIGLDGRHALDVFKDDIGEVLARDLNKVAGYIHAAFPIEGSDTGDYVVRNLIGIDPARGWLAVGDSVESGSRVMFVRRDPESAEGDLMDMLDRMKRRVVAPPRGGVYISCVARGANMFGEAGREMELIHDRLGAFPLIGFYAGGEISNSRLYAYTGVLTLFL